jgi:hypothetical protein
MMRRCVHYDHEGQGWLMGRILKIAMYERHPFIFVYKVKLAHYQRGPTWRFITIALISTSTLHDRFFIGQRFDSCFK